MKTQIETIKKEVITVVEEEEVVLRLSKKELLLLSAALGDCTLESMKTAVRNTLRTTDTSNPFPTTDSIKSHEYYPLYTQLCGLLKKLK